MRLRTNDGRWYDTETAIHVTNKLRYTIKGNWVHHSERMPIALEEYEAIEVMLKTHGAFDMCPGYHKLPDAAKELLNEYLDNEFHPADEM